MPCTQIPLTKARLSAVSSLPKILLHLPNKTNILPLTSYPPLLPIRITIRLHLQSHLPIKCNSKIAGSTEVFENVIRGGVMLLRGMFVELRDLRYRICEIRTSAEHCIHEAANLRLVNLRIDTRFFLRVKFDELGAMRDGDGYWFHIKHLKLLKNHIDIPVLPNRNHLVGAIAIDLNAEEEYQLSNIFYVELFRKCLLDSVDRIDTSAE